LQTKNGNRKNLQSHDNNDATRSELNRDQPAFPAFQTPHAFVANLNKSGINIGLQY
jgi:hypothetical protein